MSASWMPWADLVSIIGNDAATALCLAMGGTEVYIPKDPEGGRIEAVIGPQAAAILSRRCGGVSVFLPSGLYRASMTPRIIGLLQAGWKPPRIARECKVSERHVRQILADIRRGDRDDGRRQKQFRLPL